MSAVVPGGLVLHVFINGQQVNPPLDVRILVNSLKTCAKFQMFLLGSIKHRFVNDTGNVSLHLLLPDGRSEKLSDEILTWLRSGAVTSAVVNVTPPRAAPPPDAADELEAEALIRECVESREAGGSAGLAECPARPPLTAPGEAGGPAAPAGRGGRALGYAAGRGGFCRGREHGRHRGTGPRPPVSGPRSAAGSVRVWGRAGGAARGAAAVRPYGGSRGGTPGLGGPGRTGG